MRPIWPWFLLRLYELDSLSTENNIETWLPAHDPHAQVLDWYRQEFGLDHGLLASWNGSTLNDPRVEAFAVELAGPLDEDGERHDMLPGIDTVRTPREVIRRMIENKVERDEAIHRSAGLLVGTGPLKVRLTEAGRQQQDAVIARIVDAANEQLNLNVQTLPPAVDQFYDGGRRSRRDVERPKAPSSKTSFRVQVRTIRIRPFPPHDFQLRWNDMVPQADSTQRMRDLAVVARLAVGREAGREGVLFRRCSRGRRGHVERRG